MLPEDARSQLGRGIRSLGHSLAWLGPELNDQNTDCVRIQGALRLAGVDTTHTLTLCWRAYEDSGYRGRRAGTRAHLEAAAERHSVEDLVCPRQWRDFAAGGMYCR